jgi:caa(3)-type oxidase subunit IV
MRQSIVQPVSFIWAVLVVATCFAWWSAKGGAVPSCEATAIVMTIAAVKARLVILHFMDLKAAPRMWRLLFEGWVLLSTCVILCGYWYGLDTARSRESATGSRVQRIALAAVRPAASVPWSGFVLGPPIGRRCCAS